MPILKLSNSKTTIVTSGITSSDVSNSLSGNMNLIKSQIKEKNNNYINIKNATKILEKYSNYNGYIKLYTEIESNIEVNDTVYITYTDLEENFNSATTFNLQNPIIPDENGNRFYLGYKVLYVNNYKNEIVINRYYNDIISGTTLKNQYISKVTCKNSDLFDTISDGVVFYNCNVLNGNFGTLSGIVSGSTISGATILCSGIKRYSDSNGNYSIAIPAGNNTVKCAANGYTTKTINIAINKNERLNYNILMEPGNNSITIDGKTTKCEYESIILSASTIGYDNPVRYKWYLKRNDNITSIGTNNYQIAYMLFENNDIVYCEITDDITKSKSNELVITVTQKSINISTPTNIIYYGSSVTFNVNTICYLNPTYQWKINNLTKSTNNVFTTSILKNNDVVTCIVNNDTSNSIIMNVLYFELNLGYSIYSYEDACNEVINTYYSDANNLINSNFLYIVQTGNTYAETGYYSDGIYTRYWDKSIFKFSNIYYTCDSFTTTTTTEGTTTTTTTTEGTTTTTTTTEGTTTTTTTTTI